MYYGFLLGITAVNIAYHSYYLVKFIDQVYPSTSRMFSIIFIEENQPLAYG